MQANEKLNCKFGSLERTIEKSIDERVSSVVEKCVTRIEEVVTKIIEKRLEPQIKAIPNKSGPLKTPKTHQNVKSSFRVPGLPEDLTKNKEESALLANEQLKVVMTEIGVDVKIERLQRLGKIDRERPTPRNVIVVLSNNWDVRYVLAKSAENRKRMKEMVIHILLALSAEDAKRGKMCLKKRRELLNNGITPSQLKIRNFELFQDGVLVHLSEEQLEQDWLSQLNCLFSNTRSLIDVDRRMKFATAVSSNTCMILCLTETWLTANIGDSELYLCIFNIYRTGREPTEEGASSHAGALIAVNKKIKPEQLNLRLPNCCVAVQLQLLKPSDLCGFYDHKQPCYNRAWTKTLPTLEQRKSNVTRWRQKRFPRNPRFKQQLRIEYRDPQTGRIHERLGNIHMSWPNLEQAYRWETQKSCTNALLCKAQHFFSNKITSKTVSV